MGVYAANTDVTSDRSRAEIERTLQRYGATSFAYGWEEGRAMVQFEAHNRRVRFVLPMPDRDSKEFTLTPTGRKKSPAQQESAFEQAVRQRWRALNLVVKAKLEAVESGIATFEEEFLAYIALPDGTTVGQRMVPQIDEAYSTGSLPALMPGK